MEEAGWPGCEPRKAPAATEDELALVHSIEHVRAGLCATRPSGHHAERDRAMGFCLFNNVAIAAELAIRELGVDRILILDWDIHHGNGTAGRFAVEPTCCS